MIKLMAKTIVITMGLVVLMMISPTLALASSQTMSNSITVNGKTVSVSTNNKDFNLGYKVGIDDWNQHSADLNHKFICPIAKIAPTSDFCKGYDSAIKFQTSDQ